MFMLSRNRQILIGAVLAGLLLLTRGYHWPVLRDALPSASMAAFFLAGMYLRPAWALALLFGEAAAIDAIAIHWGGVSDFCVSPAYAALLPAYASLWLAGRMQAKYGMRLIPLAAHALIGAVACELLASGSFYFYSGRFAATSIAGFAERFAQYFPQSLLSMVFWVALAATLHHAVTTFVPATAGRPR